jgi:hypothetical protein
MTLPSFTVQSKLLTEVSQHFKWKLGQTAIYLCYQHRIPVIISGYEVLLESNNKISLRYQVTTLKSIELADTSPEINQLDVFHVSERELTENLPIYVNP